jgi:hypothetical protein
VIGIALAVAQGLAAATPGFTIKATSVSVSGQGSGSSQITLQSVNGFAGQVMVTCQGPETNIAPDLLLPVCNSNLGQVTIPAGGSASLTAGFNPPWMNTAAMNSGGRPAGPGPASPLAAGAVSGLLLLGLRMQRVVNQRLLLLAAALLLAPLAGLIGCLNKGGLAMTPGAYSYSFTGFATSATPSSVSTTIYVTVNCDSCP